MNLREEHERNQREWQKVIDDYAALGKKFDRLIYWYNWLLGIGLVVLAVLVARLVYLVVNR